MMKFGAGASLMLVVVHLVSCSGGKLTSEEIVKFDQTTFDMLKDCAQTSRYSRGRFQKHCDGKTGVFYADVLLSGRTSYQIKRDSCEGSDKIGARHSERGLFDDPLVQLRASNRLPRCVKAVWRVDGDEGLRPLHLLEEETDAEKLAREERAEKARAAEQLRIKQERLEKERLAKEEKERERRESAEKLERNKNDAEWLGNQYGLIATPSCKRAVQSLARYDYEWTDGWLDMKFPSFLSEVKEPFTVTFTGDRIKFQNGFGAWQKKQYYCDYDVKRAQVVRAYVR